MVTDGTIANALSTPINNANVDISANTISASQSASSVTGKKLKLDATAKNAAKKKASNSQQASNPVNIAFHNTGSIMAGTPNVNQGTTT